MKVSEILVCFLLVHLCKMESANLIFLSTPVPYLVLCGGRSAVGSLLM